MFSTGSNMKGSSIYECMVVTVIIFNEIAADRGLVMWRNKRDVKAKALNRACSLRDCRNTKCTQEYGWNLYGSDWGCCGNYEGCCTWASVVCYAHDAVCKCCDSWYCGPDCQKEPECSNGVPIQQESSDYGDSLESSEHFHESKQNRSGHETISPSADTLPETNATESMAKEPFIESSANHSFTATDAPILAKTQEKRKADKRLHSFSSVMGIRYNSSHNETDATLMTNTNKKVIDASEVNVTNNNTRYVVLNVSVSNNRHNSSHDVYNRTFSDQPSSNNAVSSSLTVSLAFGKHHIYDHLKGSKYFRENLKHNKLKLTENIDFKKKDMSDTFVQNTDKLLSNKLDQINHFHTDKKTQKLHFKDSLDTPKRSHHWKNNLNKLKDKLTDSTQFISKQTIKTKQQIEPFDKQMEDDFSSPSAIPGHLSSKVKGHAEGADEAPRFTTESIARSTVVNIQRGAGEPSGTSLLWNIYHSLLDVFGREDSVTTDNEGSMETHQEQHDEMDEGSGEVML